MFVYIFFTEVIKNNRTFAFSSSYRKNRTLYLLD